MRRRAFAGLAACSLAAGIAVTARASHPVVAVAAPVPGRDAADRSSPVTYSHNVLHLRAAVAGAATREVHVWRPNIPDAPDLPVVYFLHGVPGSARDVANSGLPAELARSAMPFVLVAPDGWGEKHGDTEWADAADGSDPIESFLTDIVIPSVEGTNPRDRNHRAIAGFSMGGYGAANIAMRHPDLFGSVVSVAGYFHIDDPDQMFGGQPSVEAANDPGRDVTRARSLRIMLVEDSSDSCNVCRGEASRFAAVLQRAGIAATVDITPGNHSWSYVASVFGRVEDFLEDGWAEASAPRAAARALP